MLMGMACTEGGLLTLKWRCRGRDVGCSEVLAIWDVDVGIGRLR